jgi:predicted HTH domain antitoxin
MAKIICNSSLRDPMSILFKGIQNLQTKFFQKGVSSMALKDSSVMVGIPEELLPLLNDLVHGKSVDENVLISLAISFFVGKTVSLAKASEIAGLSLNDFIYILNTRNIPWSEYTESDFLRDSVAIRELVRESGD